MAAITKKLTLKDRATLKDSLEKMCWRCISIAPWPTPSLSSLFLFFSSANVRRFRTGYCLDWFPGRSPSQVGWAPWEAAKPWSAPKPHQKNCEHNCGSHRCRIRISWKKRSSLLQMCGAIDAFQMMPLRCWRTSFHYWISVGKTVRNFCRSLIQPMAQAHNHTTFTLANTLAKLFLFNGRRFRIHFFFLFFLRFLPNWPWLLSRCLLD